MLVALFDIDGTLYPIECELTASIDGLVTEFVAEHLGLDVEAADALRTQSLRTRGSTLRGLMELHGTDPKDYYDYLSATDPRNYLSPDPALRDMLRSVTARRAILTNAPRTHAEGVLDALGVADAFELMLTIEDSGYRGKPDPIAYEGVLDALGADPSTVTMIEDTRRCLGPARELGMRTILVGVRHAARGVGTDVADAVIDRIHRLPDVAPWLFGPA